jgi:hypothetical protein
MPSRTYNDQYANKAVINSGQTGSSVVDDLTIGGAATVAETLAVTGVLTATGGVSGDITGDITGDVTGDLTGDLTPAAETTEHGAGIIGTAATPVTYRWIENGVIITDFKVDVTGLASVATANDVIGLSAGGNAYIRQYNVATDGVVYKAELVCIETPAGGDNDINVVANSSGTLAYDGAGGTTYGINGGDAVAGQVIANLVQGLTDTHYFYLTAGTGDTAAAYTAGMFIFRTYGHALLA